MFVRRLTSHSSVLLAVAFATLGETYQIAGCPPLPDIHLHGVGKFIGFETVPRHDATMR